MFDLEDEERKGREKEQEKERIIGRLIVRRTISCNL